MADVLDHFLRGHAAGQAQLAHQQQLETSKLQQTILKHELDRLKLDDSLRTYELQQRHADLQFGAQQGRPFADMAKEDATMPPGTMEQMLTQAFGTPQASPAQQAFGAPQGAVTPTPQQQPAAIAYPALPTELGGGAGFSRRPQSLEQLVQARTAEKLAEPFTIKGGEKRMVGRHVVAEGGPEIRSVGAGGLASLNPDGTVKTVVPGRAPASEPVVPVPDGHGGYTYTPRSKAAGQPAPGPQGTTPAERDATRRAQQDREQYDDFAKQWTEDQRSRKVDAPGQEDMLPGAQRQRERAPYEAPPTFADWLDAGKPSVAGVHQIRANKAKGIPAPRVQPQAPAAAAAPPGAPADGTRGTINGRPVVWKTIPGQGAGWVPIGQ